MVLEHSVCSHTHTAQEEPWESASVGRLGGREAFLSVSVCFILCDSCNIAYEIVLFEAPVYWSFFLFCSARQGASLRYNICKAGTLPGAPSLLHGAYFILIRATPSRTAGGVGGNQHGPRARQGPFRLHYLPGPMVGLS